LRLRGSSSLFDRGYTIQFELDGQPRPTPISCAGLLIKNQGVSVETSILSGTNHFTILSLVGNGDDTLIDRMVEFAREVSSQ